MGIVHYGDDAGAGGSLRVGETLANHLDPQKVEAHLLFAYGGPGPVAQNARVPCHFLGSKGPKDLRGWLRARRKIRGLDFDLLHFMDPVSWLQLALLGLRPARLLHVHGRFLPAYITVLDRLVWRALARIAAGQVCISEGARRTLLAIGWGQPDRTWTVHNALDCKYFEQLPSKTAARNSLGLPQHAKILGMVCRLNRYRGCDDAMRILTRLGPGWHLLLCGDGPFRHNLEALAEELGVQNRVHFVGLLGDVRPAYAALDAFAMLARYESFGLATCEAMLTGVPVFGLAGGGEYREPEYPLVTQDNAIFVERSRPDDLQHETPERTEVLDALAEPISEYGEQPAKYQPMIERARRWVIERFDAPIQAEAMTVLYTKIMHAQVRPSADSIGTLGI